MMLAVNRAFGKSDYIPYIAWGRNAQYASRFAVGDRVTVEPIGTIPLKGKSKSVFVYALTGLAEAAPSDPDAESGASVPAH